MTDDTNMQKLKEAHAHCSNNREAIERSKLCGCFYCLNHFLPSDIKEWVAKNGDTALCPKCGIDAVLADNTGYIQDDSFMSDMYNYWFRTGTKVTMKNGKVIKEEKWDSQKT